MIGGGNKWGLEKFLKLIIGAGISGGLGVEKNKLVYFDEQHSYSLSYTIYFMYNFSLIHFFLLVYYILENTSENKFNFNHELLEINKWGVGVSAGGW